VMIRHNYTFSRPLTITEEADLSYAIVRTDCSLTRNTDGRVIACTAHPDDLFVFLAAWRREHRGCAHLKATREPQSVRTTDDTSAKEGAQP
jgi:hypothetical protein